MEYFKRLPLTLRQYFGFLLSDEFTHLNVVNKFHPEMKTAIFL